MLISEVLQNYTAGFRGHIQSVTYPEKAVVVLTDTVVLPTEATEEWDIVYKALPTPFVSAVVAFSSGSKILKCILDDSETIYRQTDKLGVQLPEGYLICKNASNYWGHITTSEIVSGVWFLSYDGD